MTYCYLQAQIGNYFAQSNLAGKWIVVILLTLSLVAWTIMVRKFIEFKRLKQRNVIFLSRWQKSSRSALWQSLIENSENLKPSDVYGCEYLMEQTARMLGFSKEKSPEILEGTLSQVLSQLQSYYESKMVILSSIVAGAPFLGLLGTVWGVMDAFGNIQGAVQIGDLAPGVSGALLTTVAALLVAIPCVFGYNFLVAKIKEQRLCLESFAQDLYMHQNKETHL